MQGYTFFCLAINLKKEKGLYDFIKQLSKDNDVHIFEINQYKKLNTQDFIRLTDLHVNGPQIANVTFVTNIKSIFNLNYRFYHNIYSNFIYYNSVEHNNITLNSIYNKLMSLDISPNENLYKPIYSNDVVIDDLLHNCKDDDIHCLPLETVHEDLERTTCEFEISTRYYELEDQFYVFETINTFKKTIIYPTGLPQTYENTHYMSDSATLISEEVYNMLFHNFDNLIKNYETFFSSIKDKINAISYFEQQMLLLALTDMSFLKRDNRPYQAILLLSFLGNYTESSDYYDLLSDFVLNADNIQPEQQYFIYQQLKTIFFSEPSLCSAITADNQNKIYKKVFSSFESYFHESLKPIKKEDRNKDLVVVICYQFLSEKHPPTHTTLERAYNLVKSLNKNVIIINTHEHVTEYGAVPFFDTRCANLVEGYNEVGQVTYKDLNIPFCQIEEPMPSYYSIQEILNFVRDNKPYFILNIGGSSITADLCGKLVPELSMGVVFSSLPRTVGDLSIIGRKIKDTEWNSLSSAGYAKENIIESTFTFELRPQLFNYTKRDLGLLEDRFLMIVVGNRLNDDITDEYISYISKTFTHGTHLVLVGEFSNYNTLCEKYPLFRENTSYLGYVDEVLSIMDNIDLYVNPKRMGGGFSITEALYKGKPGVTIDYGDVAVAAGEDFCVNNYDELVDMIIKYSADAKFYDMMSQKALKRAEILTDSGKALKDIVEKAERNKYFF